MGSRMVWRGGAGGVVQFLDKVVDESVVVLGPFLGTVQLLDEAADVPVLSLRLSLRSSPRTGSPAFC